MSELVIRPALNADSEAVIALIFGILAEYGLAGDLSGTDLDLADIEGSYAGRGGYFDVVQDESGAIVGSVGLYPLGDGAVELRKMYLDKSLRGKGIGKRLLEAAITRARALGFDRIELETNSRLLEAIALYRRYGFQPIEGQHLASRCDQNFELRLTE